MIKQHLVLAGVAAVVAVVAVWAGAPVSTVLLVVLFLACPVMMIFMMRSMSGDHTGRGHDPAEHGQGRGPQGTDVS
ncbi:unnamed protein product [[Actinomadura] parvosata subsp. kistnae]|uniref:DUF2933 domain-containing protein n=1 Tax=[Actinomadura] parvosata subsp. kistnae TaxID=1909395 RepID=A0A1U9ZYU4_9ACTN|nr:DUF2933 domain-containing protein [Nonomuraea sp. ATCC 55076]AQZ63100.1 hypothetical protein BKM31_17975 [Nonomuraea sp. ATCC 55076]SPL98731.1 unnamed protein product [Actinomadura parvosata subsp. kistnae]